MASVTNRPTTSVSAWLMVLVAAAALRCNECNLSEGYCDNGQLYLCVPSGNGSEVLNTTTRSFQPSEQCGDAALCVEPTTTTAECVVSPEPDPACPPRAAETTACSGTTYVECQLGYRTKFVACASCDANAYDHPCGGVVGDPCGSDSNCAPPLSCHSFADPDGGVTKACSQPCSGNTNACVVGSGLSLGRNAPVPATFPAVDATRVTCVAGWCALH